MKSRVYYTKDEVKFKQGELYISTDTNTIVICNESTNSKTFKGTCLVKGDCFYKDNNWLVGEHCNTCHGPLFSPFKGTIELIGE